MRGRLLFCSVLLLLAPAGTAWAESAIVTSATGGVWGPGAQVDTGRTLILAEGEGLKLVTVDGDVIVLKGPYAGVPARIPAHSPLRTSFADMFPRAGAEAGAAVDPWAIDFDRDRDRSACVKAGQYVSFHRGDVARDSGFEVRSAGSWHLSEKWQAGQHDQTIGTNYPIRDGGDYTVSRDDGASVSLVVAPDWLSTDRMLATWMSIQGCDAQAKLFAARAH